MKKLSTLLLAFTCIPAIMTAQKINYPTTTKVEQTDDYFGTKIQDRTDGWKMIRQKIQRNG
jgi:hypothetical protein